MMKRNNQKHVETMIGEDAVITGEIVLNGGAIISGKVMGNVKASGTVRVTRTGTIEGDIEAGEATVGGTVHGNVQAVKVVLRGDSKVHGDIVYKQLVIEEGASFEGRCDIDTNQPLPESEKLQLDGTVAQEEHELPTEESPSQYSN